MFTLTTVCMDCGRVICSSRTISEDTADRLMAQIDREGGDALYMEDNAFFRESICNVCDTSDDDEDWM